jgi:hypothetical protein
MASGSDAVLRTAMASGSDAVLPDGYNGENTAPFIVKNVTNRPC